MGLAPCCSELWLSSSCWQRRLERLSFSSQVGEEASIAVKSTCPCNFTLHYEVVSRGNIVLSGLQSGNVTQQRSRRATVSSGRSVHIAHSPGTVFGAGEVVEG